MAEAINKPSSFQQLTFHKIVRQESLQRSCAFDQSGMVFPLTLRTGAAINNNLRLKEAKTLLFQSLELPIMITLQLLQIKVGLVDQNHLLI